MKLAELLDSSPTYKIVRNTSSEYHAQAKIGDRTIRIEAFGSRGTGAWDIGFSEINLKTMDSSMSKTGSGNEIAVFAVVKSFIEQLVKEKDVKELSFSAEAEEEKDNRISLYKRLVKRFAKDWDVEEDSNTYSTKFILKRKRK